MMVGFDGQLEWSWNLPGDKLPGAPGRDDLD